jgi:hypothetical protein
MASFREIEGQLKYVIRQMESDNQVVESLLQGYIDRLNNVLDLLNDKRVETANKILLLEARLEELEQDLELESAWTGNP